MTIPERAATHVATMDAAISGNGGHNATFAVAIALIHGFNLSEDEAWPILLDYNKRCKPPWTEKELRHKLEGADNLTRHSQPRGYLRDAPSAKPAKPAKPLRLRVVTWQERVAEIAKRKTQITDAPEACEPSGARADIFETALRIFNGTRQPDDYLATDMRDRLRAIDGILNLRDTRGRPAFTGSQIESCRIGLRGFAGEHPDVDAMLQRLTKAKKTPNGICTASTNKHRSTL